MGHHVTEVSIEKISPNSRMVFDEDAIDELSRDIQCQGQVEPIVVCLAGECFRILDGEKRWRACKKIGYTSVKVVIDEVEEEDEIVWS